MTLKYEKECRSYAEELRDYLEEANKSGCTQEIAMSKYDKEIEKFLYTIFYKNNSPQQFGKSIPFLNIKRYIVAKHIPFNKVKIFLPYPLGKIKDYTEEYFEKKYLFEFWKNNYSENNYDLLIELYEANRDSCFSSYTFNDDRKALIKEEDRYLYIVEDCLYYFRLLDMCETASFNNDFNNAFIWFEQACKFLENYPLKDVKIHFGNIKGGLSQKPDKKLLVEIGYFMLDLYKKGTDYTRSNKDGKSITEKAMVKFSLGLRTIQEYWSLKKLEAVSNGISTVEEIVDEKLRTDELPLYPNIYF